MKKIVSLMLALCLILTLFTACGSKKEDANTLKVAISPDFAPMEFVDPSKEGQDKFVGFDVTLAKFIAEQMGKELVIQPMSFDACQTAVYTGTVDMSISGFSWTEEREENYNISDYYHAGDNEDGQILITLEENLGKFGDIGTGAGLKIGAQTASLQESLVLEQLPDCEIVTIGDLGTAVLQLQNGDFDALAVAQGNGAAIIAGNPDAGVVESGFAFVVDEKYTGNVILLQKGADDLTAQVNSILAEAEQYYDDWYAEAQSIAGVDVSYDDEGNAIEG